MPQTVDEPKIILVLDSLHASAAERALAAKPLPVDIGKPLFRRLDKAATRALADSGYNAADHTVTLTISSEFPVERWDGTEVLLHGPENVDTSRLANGISHLYNHDWDMLLGRTTDFTVADRKLSVTSKFGSNEDAKKREQDMADGILPDVSLGYMILEVEVTEDKYGKRTYEAIRWMPYEWSSVTVPADFTVGLDRAAPPAHEVTVRFKLAAHADPAAPTQERKSNPDPNDDDPDEDEEDEERKNQRSVDVSAAAASSSASTETSTTQPTQQRNLVMEDLQALNKARVDGLRSLREQYPDDFSERQLLDGISGDLTTDQARGAILTSFTNRSKTTEVRSATDEVFGRMSDKETRSYSMRNAIAATINQRQPGTFKDKGAAAGFEREVSTELEKTLSERGIPASGNILVPSALGQRSLQAGGNAGANTINTETSSSVIDMLRARCRTLALGVTQMTMSTGLLRLPRQTSTATSQWLAELGAGSNSDAAFDYITWQPKRNGIVGTYTLELLAQSGIDVEAFIRRDQLASKARTYDAVIIAGTGANNMPLGVLNMSGLGQVLPGATRAADGTVTAGTGGKPLSFVDINNFEALISNVNGDTDSLGWLYTPRVRASMRSTAKFPGTGGFMPLLPDSATGADGLQEGPLGYKAGVTTNGLPTNGSVTVNSVAINGLHTVMLGVWSNVIAANWGVSELVYDNITGAKQGLFQIIENEFMDVNCTHIEGFAASTTVLPS